MAVSCIRYGLGASGREPGCREDFAIHPAGRQPEIGGEWEVLELRTARWWSGK